MNSFSQFLDGIDSYSNMEEVGLAIYYLQTYGGEDEITASDVRALFTMNSIPMGESTIAAHIHRMAENEWLRRTEKDFSTRYFLSPDGLERFERLAEEGISSPPPEEVTNEDLRDQYENLYEETLRVRDELQDTKQSAERWRWHSWLWRFGSFVIGMFSGSIATVLL